MPNTPLTSLRLLAIAACLSVALATIGCAQLRWSDDAKATAGKTEEAATKRANRQRESSSRLRRDASRTSIATDPAAAERRIANTSGDDAGITTAQVGYFMDVHEARLRQAITDTPVNLGRDGERLLLTLSGTATFGSGSATLMNDVRPALDSIARVLVEFDKTLVTVQGHTDDRGDAEFNQALSQRRALAVATYLRDRGIDAQRLVAIGMGETQPTGDNATPEGRAGNRRVEIIVQPLLKAAGSNLN